MTVKTRLYCCGGLGVNLGQSRLHTELDVCYIDTSQSNRTEGLDADKCHYIAGLDGSGKNRRHNHETIAREVPRFLEAFEPGDFNIVLFSAAGGTGSVAGPLIVRQLLSRGHAVVAITVGTDDTAIAVTNTINTLKSLEAISAGSDLPVVMAYHENTSGVPRRVVDDEVVFVLEAFGQLASQANRELDTQDVTNLVQFSRVTSVRPQLSSVMVFDNRPEAAQQVEPVAVASLYADPDQDTPFGSPHYNTTGYPRSEDLVVADQLHFVINTTDVEETFRRLDERQQALNKAYNSYRQRKTRVDVDDNITQDGLVL